jgi:hypothetical protein
MSTDNRRSKPLIDRLREVQALAECELYSAINSEEVREVCGPAADEIERLRAALERIAHAKSSVLNAEQFARAESMLQRWAADALNKTGLAAFSEVRT